MGYLAAGAGVGLCTLFVLLTPEEERLATLALLYVLAIAGATILGGLGPGLLAAVLAFLTISLVLAPPREHPFFSQPVEWVSLLIFVGLAGLLHDLLARARAEAAMARQQEREARAIADLVQTASAVEGLQPLLDALVAWARATFGFAACALLLPGPDGRLRVHAQAGGPADEPAEGWLTVSRAHEALDRGAIAWEDGPDGRVAHCPLVAGERAVGVLCMRLDRADGLTRAPGQRLLGAFARQAGLAIERARLRAAATEAEVLRRSDALKSTLLTTVSHELRTPLAVIKAAATSLLEQGAPTGDPATRELAAAIDREADRLHRLVSDLLDLSRIEGGALRLALGWYEPGELVREAVARCRGTAGPDRVAVHAPDDLPPILVDYVLMDRVLANLVGNALRYAPPDEPVRVAVERVGPTVVITVADAGPGVPAAELERVFEKFHRVAGRDGDAGLGLGLAICKGIVEAHGGRIWAESPVDRGRGVAFHVALPLASRDQAGRGAREEEAWKA